MTDINKGSNKPKSVYKSKIIVKGNPNADYPSVKIIKPGGFTPIQHKIQNNIIQNNKTTIESLSNHKSLFPIDQSKKTLLLDLDETLIYSSNNKIFQYPPDNTIFISLKHPNQFQKIFIYKRPYLKEFLEQMSQLYELMIFTASQPSYANSIINKIDPNKYCSKRLYRDQCKLINNSLIKDLSIINRHLSNVILIDNSPISYSVNRSNGIPISSWFGTKQDSELQKLCPLLEYLSKVNDVRQYISSFVERNIINYDKFNSTLRRKASLSRHLNDHDKKEDDSCHENVIKDLLNDFDNNIKKHMIMTQSLKKGKVFFKYIK